MVFSLPIFHCESEKWVGCGLARQQVVSNHDNQSVLKWWARPHLTGWEFQT